MSLPWLQDDYKRPESHSRSRSRSGSRGRHQRSEEGRNRRSRSRSPARESRGGPRGGDRGRGGGRRGGDRSPDRGRRKRGGSSSSDSSDSRDTPTRIVASNRQKYVNARIFVANISSKDLMKTDIISHFEKYGNVVDCLIHPKNYIFVQYLKEEHAQLAVQGEHGSTFNGFRIDVKMAKENRKGNQTQNRDNRDTREDVGPTRPPRDHPYGPDPFLHDRRPPPPFPPPGGEFGMRDPYFPPDPYRRGYPPDPWLPPDDPYRRDPFGDPYRDPYGARSIPPPLPVGPVECEVFLINPQIRTYGEMIERRVKDQSVMTSLSILPEGRTAPQMVEDLTAKGGLFAIFLNAQNEMHRSLTLNILHGTPQEHRNMPLDDAIGLIGRSFEKYVEELRAKGTKKASGGATGASSSSTISRVFMPPSSEITYLLNLLADNRAVTVSEIDTVIEYLQERRDKLVDADKRPVITDDSQMKKFVQEKSRESSSNQVMTTPESKDSTHEELTKKILSIFQGVDPAIIGNTPQPAPAPAPAPAMTSGSGANLINFDNPNVQKALDNLIQSGPSLLKTFTSTSAAVSGSNTISSSSSSSSKINLAPPVGSGVGDGMLQHAGGSGMMPVTMGMEMAAMYGSHPMAYNIPGMGGYPPMPRGGPPPPPPPSSQRY